nr:unnamed protein product [Callosobruchus chinensis]
MWVRFLWSNYFSTNLKNRTASQKTALSKITRWGLVKTLVKNCERITKRSWSVYSYCENKELSSFTLLKSSARRGKGRLETEMERITYKLCLLNKSLAQRINAKTCYDKTLQEMEEKYANLVKNSADLLMYIKEEFSDLESMINKKTSTDEGPTGGYVVDTQASGERGQLGGKTCKCKPLRQRLIPEEHVEIGLYNTV